MAPCISWIFIRLRFLSRLEQADMTTVKSLFFLIFVVGLGAGYILFVLLPREPQVETGLFAYLAFPLWLLGGVTILTG